MFTLQDGQKEKRKEVRKRKELRNSSENVVTMQFNSPKKHLPELDKVAVLLILNYNEIKPHLYVPNNSDAQS